MATQQTAFLRHLQQLAATHGSNRHSDRELLSRFSMRGDQDAFATLLRRHGPMVLHVCRRVLPPGPDVEDAFQATFVILARKARSERWQESIANWIYGVAYRVARKARANAARRRVKERGVRRTAPIDPLSEVTGRELLTVLDEELVRVPEKLRAPLILCYLEGATRDEAARRLACPLGTLKSRMERGREMLRVALGRRGWDLSAVLAASLVAGSSASANAPVHLMDAALEVAANAMAGKAVSSIASATVATLVNHFCRLGVPAKWPAAAALMLLTTAGWTAACLIHAEPVQAPSPISGLAQAQKPQANEQPTTDFYGDPLPPGAVARLGTSRWRPGNTVTRLAFSPDNKLVASGGWNDHFVLWDAATGKVIQRYAPRHARLQAFAFQPNGRSLAIHGTEPNIHLWDFLSGQTPPTFAPPETGVLTLVFDPNAPVEDKEYIFNAFAISPDGKTLATGSRATVRKSMIRLWDMSTSVELANMKMVRMFGGHDHGITWMAFSADGSALLTASHANDLKNYTICVWETATGKELGRLQISDISAQGFDHPLAISPNGRLVAIGRKDGTIRLWKLGEANDGVDLQVGSECGSLAFAPDGKILASGGRDKIVRLWDVTIGRELHQFRGHNSWIEAVAFSPDGNVLASSGQDRCIRLWSVATGDQVSHAIGHDFHPSALALSPDGRTAFTGGWDDAIFAWDTATGKELRHFVAKQRGVLSLAVSPDGRRLASAGNEHELRIWDAATGQEVRTISGHAGGCGAVAFSPDGKKLVSSGRDHTIRIWEISSGGELLKIQGKVDEDFGIGATFSPDGKLLAAATVTRSPRDTPIRSIDLWDASTGQEIRQMQNRKSYFFTLAFSPDGHFLAAGAMSGNWGFTAGGESLASSEFRDSVLLWDLKSGEIYRTFPGDSEENWRGSRQVYSLTFTPDCKSLITAENHGAIHVYDIASAELKRRIMGHHDRVGAIALSADGRRLVSLSDDLTGLVWDLAKLK